MHQDDVVAGDLDILSKYIQRCNKPNFATIPPMVVSAALDREVVLHGYEARFGSTLLEATDTDMSFEERSVQTCSVRKQQRLNIMGQHWHYILTS